MMQFDEWLGQDTKEEEREMEEYDIYYEKRNKKKVFKVLFRRHRVKMGMNALLGVSVEYWRSATLSRGFQTLQNYVIPSISSLREAVYFHGTSCLVKGWCQWKSCSALAKRENGNERLALSHFTRSMFAKFMIRLKKRTTLKREMRRMENENQYDETTYELQRGFKRWIRWVGRKNVMREENEMGDLWREKSLLIKGVDKLMERNYNKIMGQENLTRGKDVHEMLCYKRGFNALIKNWFGRQARKERLDLIEEILMSKKLKVAFDQWCWG